MTDAQEQARERMREAEAEGVKRSHEQRERKANGADGQGPREHLALRYLADIEARKSSRYLVKGWINAGEFVVIAGATGCGKTHLATDFGIHVAVGRAWRGFRVRRAGVLFVAAEGGTAIDDRIAAMKDEFGDVTNPPFAVIADSLDLCHDNDDARLLTTRCREAAAQFGCDVGLVILDTLSRALAGGDENSPQDMGGFVRACDVLRADTGAALVAIHHLGKDLSKGARGHSLLRAAADTEILVTRDDATKAITARVDKQRAGPSGAEAFVALEVVDLGVDDDGDAITACRVVDAAKPSPTSDDANLTKNQATVFRILKAAGALGLATGQWFEEAKAQGVAEKRKADFFDCRAALKRKGLVYESGDRWVAKP